MNRTVIGIIVVLVLMPTASSWMCRPATWMINMEEDYEITPQEVTLSLENDENLTIHVILSADILSPLTKGYAALPDLTWVMFEHEEISIGAHDEQQVNVTIDIPNVTENYGKAWEFFICADQTAGGETQGGAVFQYDYNLRWKIRTPETYVPENEREEHTIAPIMVLAGLLIVAGTIGMIALRKKQ